MGEKFLAMLDFATRNIGKLNECNFYGRDYATIEVTASDGKVYKITLNVEEEKKENA